MSTVKLVKPAPINPAVKAAFDSEVAKIGHGRIGNAVFGAAAGNATDVAMYLYETKGQSAIADYVKLVQSQFVAAYVAAETTVLGRSKSAVESSDEVSSIKTLFRRAGEKLGLKDAPKGESALKLTEDEMIAAFTTCAGLDLLKSELQFALADVREVFAYAVKSRADEAKKKEQARREKEASAKAKARADEQAAQAAVAALKAAQAAADAK